MTRYELEEAVQQAKQLLHTVRGIDGLVHICEASLNATQVIDGLKEEETKLLQRIEALKKNVEEAVGEEEKTLFKVKKEHEKVRNQLSTEISQLAFRRDKLNSDYEKAKAEYQVKNQELKTEHDNWMADCSHKQRVANDQLTVVTAQLDAILAARGGNH